MHFALTVTQDLICPWCYIGLANLTNAIKTYSAAHPEATFSTRFSAFELNSNLPTPGVDKQAYLAEHLGTGPAYDAARARVRTAAERAGLPYARDETGAKVGNTLNGHRLVWWAAGSYLDRFKASGNKVSEEKPLKQQKQALAESVVDVLHKVYFYETKDLSVTETLADAAAEAGMDRAEVVKFIESDEGRDEVRREAFSARAKGVTGVPFVEVNGYGMQGGIGADSWLQVFDKVAELETKKA